MAKDGQFHQRDRQDAKLANITRHQEKNIQAIQAHRCVPAGRARPPERTWQV